MNKTLFIAHRGGGAGVFENKRETIKQSLTKDGVIAIHHDRGVYINVKRVWIDSLLYSEIKHLGISTLYEVMQLANKYQKIINIDIKDESCTTALVDFLKRNKFQNKLYIDCFSLETLFLIEEAYPNGIYSLTHNPKDTYDFTRRFVVKILLLLTSIFFSRAIVYILRKKFQKVAVDGITIYSRFATKNFVKDLKTFGFLVFVYGVTKKSQIDQFTAWEVDGIKTERIDLFQKTS